MCRLTLTLSITAGVDQHADKVERARGIRFKKKFCKRLVTFVAQNEMNVPARCIRAQSDFETMRALHGRHFSGEPP